MIVQLPRLGAAPSKLGASDTALVGSFGVFVLGALAFFVIFGKKLQGR